MAGFLIRGGAVALLTVLSIPGSALAADMPGAAVFQSHCALCHKATANGHGIGPSLYGVVGRTSGTLPGFAYSKAMKSAALVWTPAELHSYLTAPHTVVPGTKMTYAGKTSPQQLDDLVEFLETLK